MRLAALYSHPVQYTAPLFRELSSRPGIDLTVYYLSRHGVSETFDPNFGCTFKWDTPLLEGYKYEFLPNLRRTSQLNGFFKLFNTSVVCEIRARRYDAILVHGYEHFAKWLAFFAAKSVGTRLIFRGESHLNEPRRLSVRAAKNLVLRSLFKMFDSVAYIGTMNRRYYEAYGVDPRRLYLAPYSVDDQFFAGRAEQLTPQRTSIRNSIGIMNSAPVILYVGKLIDVKQPELLLRAFADVRKLHECHLVFVGDGALRHRIETLAEALAVPNVMVTGFVNQSRLPEMFACGDIMVLPSWREPWGLVVNEAMASGLPIVTTDRVGCATDLVEEGGNGYVVSHCNGAELAEKLGLLVADKALCYRFGRRSAELIREWSIEKTADGIIRAATGEAAVT